ncbi:hypothetical protein DFH08DRAFT_951395 [Mycena albidolilacea]|uniref:Uncharacterized protein n=1 Tax=Mycena albidolilacea TaxID=1033008 RepID=A0AAD7F0T2_9AGAR|nr:hypothetical protein DFH08DRAFT_951395 [Mycena albidolilacea]
MNVQTWQASTEAKVVHDVLSTPIPEIDNEQPIYDLRAIVRCYYARRRSGYTLTSPFIRSPARARIDAWTSAYSRGAAPRRVTAPGLGPEHSSLARISTAAFIRRSILDTHELAHGMLPRLCGDLAKSDIDDLTLHIQLSLSDRAVHTVDHIHDLGRSRFLDPDQRPRPLHPTGLPSGYLDRRALYAFMLFTSGAGPLFAEFPRAGSLRPGGRACIGSTLSTQGGSLATSTISPLPE